MSIENNKLLSEKLPKLFIQYCFPALFAMVIAGIQGIIDGIFVGNFIGPNAMASVNIANPFLQLIIGLSMVVSVGTQSHVGLMLGMGETKRAQDAFQTFFRMVILFAFVIVVLGGLLNKQLGVFLGADNFLLPDVSSYIKTISLFSVSMCLMFYFGFMNRILNRPQLYLYGSILSILVNIMLDYIFIAKLNWGTTGAALATGIAYSSALLFVMWPLLDRNNVLNIFVGKFSNKCIAPVLYNGCSEGLNSLSVAITTFLFNTVLMGMAGASGVAAFTAINYIGTFGSFLLFGISDGVGPIVSYNFGHGSVKRVRSIMKMAYTVNFVSGLLIFIILFFFGEVLVGLFIKDDIALTQMAVNGGKLYAFAFLMSGFNILNSGYFTFIGKGLESAIIAASRGFVFVSIGIFALPLFLSINGIWLSVPFAEFAAMLIGCYFLKKGFRKQCQK